MNYLLAFLLWFTGLTYSGALPQGAMMRGPSLSQSPSGTTFTYSGNYVDGSSGTNSVSSSATITGVGAHAIIVVDWGQSITAGTFTGETCTDNHAHTYSMTTQSPYGPVATASDHFVAGIAYFLSPPSGSSTVTCTASGVTGSIYCSVNVVEFDYTGTAPTYDKDALQTYPSSSLTSAAILPAIIPTFTQELIFAAFTTDQGGPGATALPWTVTGDGADYYILSSAPGSIASNFADTTYPDSAGLILAAFK